ncbi:trimethylamine methyltransferase family protein [Candidatus Formimonas warabiya]|uniref:Trimethylamine methyltransferase n=1 Tax=Formimonas warabiya TaxID=1761012 RepID=A0A3G1KZ50_FORW1|nr:trimethylamine methyltransferase family protein [Candidatus Formimonas warabiya]ATW27762.1 hypothetical protein DCMF_26100 [Candidatus Formimonas warabiya]
MAKMFTKVLSNAEVGEIYERSLTLLENKGVVVDHPEALQLLDKAGAAVDWNTKTVRFSRAVTEAALKVVPKSFLLAAHDPKYDLPFPAPRLPFYIRPNTGGPHYLEPGGTHRPIYLEDVINWTRLADALPPIDFTSLPSTSGLPQQSVDVHTYRTVVAHTNKHTWIQPYSKGSVKVIINMAAMLAGGYEKLRERPLISMIACSLTPLEFKAMDVEVVLQCARYGVPIFCSSLPTAGGTSPITPAGTILLASTEVLAQVVMAQLFHPGSPVFANVMLFSMDMRNGGCFIHSVEATLQNAGIIQFIKEGYGIYTHTYGFGSDSNTTDSQCMIERAMHSTLIAGSGANILGGAGQLEVACTISPLQLVIDAEIGAMLKRELGGVDVTEDTLALEEILNLPPGGNFVESMHTLRHCRDNLVPMNFNRVNREMWLREGSKDLTTKALDMLSSIMNQPLQTYRTMDQLQQLDQMVKSADVELKK